MTPSAPDRGMAARTPAFEAIGLQKEFDDGQVQALRGVDFEIAEGEFVAITGPSGCGKTTLLQMLGGLDRPSEGTLRYRGQSIADLPDLAAYRAREIGFVFQAFHLLPTFTSFENVQIPMFETDRSHSQRDDRAVELLKLSDWIIGSTIFRPSSPAGKDNASPSREAWPTVRPCSWLTNPLATWTA